MPAAAARALWEVTAGLIPGQADAKHTRRFGLTVEQWETVDHDQLENGGLGELLDVWQRAVAYATFLQLLCANGREVNWVRIDFVWP